MVAGCDSAFRVRGVALHDAGCTVSIIDESTGKVYDNFEVQGEFTETIVFGVGIASFPSFVASVNCGGKHVRTVEISMPTPKNLDIPVELGSFAP